MKVKAFLFAIVMALLAGVSFAGINPSITKTFNNFGYHSKQWNRGMMTALMSNLDQTSIHTTCVKAADTASDELLLLFAFALYSTGGFNLGIFLQQINIFMILLMQQYEDCGVNELNIQWDTIMSKPVDATSVGVNFTTMMLVGYSSQDTAPYKAWDYEKTGWQNKDFLYMGEGFQLFFAQLSKYDAPELQLEVDIMSI